MGTLNIKYLKRNQKYELLHINRARGQGQLMVKIYRYRDKDTRQVVIYIPSLEISGYGATEKKAEQMIQFSLDNFFSFMLELSPAQMDAELKSLGWKHSAYKKKEYSKSFVDSDGNLKNFNAVGDQVEEAVLSY